MLKIKDNVDLKELEKFGFKPKYDENTGQICAYQKKCEKDVGGLLVNITEITSLIRIYRAFKGKNKIWRINKYNDYFDIDTLYDLIQAGLVEEERWKDDIITKQNKIIDLMAEFIFQNIDVEEEICNSAYIECKQETAQDITCINCIKQYFERKSEE